MSFRKFKYRVDKLLRGARADDRWRKNEFHRKFERNSWKDPESVSGSGSTLKYTTNLRAQLPGLFKEHGIETVVDAPCGDYNWMKSVVDETGIRYIGVDIVDGLVDENNRQFKDASVSFIKADICREVLPTADLVICRDCLFHLSFADTFLALEKFLESDNSLILTSTHIVEDDHHNEDIRSGGFRLIDLFKEPYCFPKPAKQHIEDWVAPFPPRQMALWDRDQVARALAHPQGLSSYK